MLRSRPRLLPALLAVLATVALGTTGCSEHAATTAPEPARPYQETLSPSGVGSLVESVLGGGDNDVPADRLGWYGVAKVVVDPRTSTVVRGSHYTLYVPAGAVARPVTVTIREHSPTVIDVELGPDGTRFRKPVTMVIDYRETHADPFSRHWDGTLPILYLLDEQANLWGLLRGANNVLRRQYTIELEHFSRYAFRVKNDSTAGWN